MRTIGILLLAASFAHGQLVPGPRWYRSATGILGRPPANASAQELARLERYLLFSQAGCVALTAPQYAANQAMARSMAPYLAAVGSTAADPEARAAASRLTLAFAAFPCAYPGAPVREKPSPPPQPGDPPFALKAPNPGQIPDAEQETAADLVIRYDTGAARSAAVWKNAEKLRISLTGRGMSLNPQTGAAVGRLQLLYEEAAAELKDHKWEDALGSLQAAEATTQKIAATVGQ